MITTFLIYYFCSRKAKYCSKACQSKAWGEGHRWWCVERHHGSQPTNPSTTTSSTTAAAAAAVVAAAPQPTQQAEQVMPLATHGTTPDVLPIPIEGRQSDIPAVDEATAPTGDATHHRSSLSFSAEDADNGRRARNMDGIHPSDIMPEGPRRVTTTDMDDIQSSDILNERSRREHHHHLAPSRRRNSRSTHSVPSGSSTEVEADISENAVTRDLMDID